MRETPKTKRCAIIGAGGIACYLAPMLSKLCDVVLVDGDEYEPKNSTRQFPALKSTGNKAKVLSGMLDEHTIYSVTGIPKFLKGAEIVNEDGWGEVDLIIGAVDNNKSRFLIAETAQMLEIPAILAGNGEWFGEAHLFFPGIYNPFDSFEFPDTEPTPWACNSDKELESSPQTAIANMMAAGAAMQIFLSLFKTMNPINLIAHVRNEYNSGTVLRVRDLVKSQEEKENEHSPDTERGEGHVAGPCESDENMAGENRRED